jgi:hypothetical protein
MLYIINMGAILLFLSKKAGIGNSTCLGYFGCYLFVFLVPIFFATPLVGPSNLTFFVDFDVFSSISYGLTLTIPAAALSFDRVIKPPFGIL